MSIYAIGDIHGQYDKMAKLLWDLDTQDDDEVVFLGDYIDRGPKSKQVIDALIKINAAPFVTCLMGNHEELCLVAHEEPTPTNQDNWIFNGGIQTLASYKADHLPADHLAFMKGLPLHYETDDYIFVPRTACGSARNSSTLITTGASASSLVTRHSTNHW